MSSSHKAIAGSPRARTWPRGYRALRCAGCWEVGLASRTRLQHERPDPASAGAVATRSGPAARLRPSYNARPATCRNPGSCRAPERRGSPIGGPAARKSGPSHTAIRGLQVPGPLVPFQLFSPKPHADPGRKPGVKEKTRLLVPSSWNGTRLRGCAIPRSHLERVPSSSSTQGNDRIQYSPQCTPHPSAPAAAIVSRSTARIEPPCRLVTAAATASPIPVPGARAWSAR